MDEKELFNKVAKATVKIECEGTNFSGSGFHFIRKDIIITNYHVIKSVDNNNIFALTESRERVKLKLLKYSNEDEYDYAILQCEENFKGEREVLLPLTSSPTRSMQICFSGFPHGINDLIVQKGYVSAPFKDKGFYIDASVNGGNSGGPIVELEEGKVIGIITKRRFLVPQDLEQLNKNLKAIHKHFQQMGGRSGVIISGVDFGSFAKLMSEILDILQNIIGLNSNTGIGVGYKIDFVNEVVKNLELKNATKI